MNLQESITELESLILLQKSGTFSTNFVYICIACINVVFFIFRDLPLHPESQYGSYGYISHKLFCVEKHTFLQFCTYILARRMEVIVI